MKVVRILTDALVEVPEQSGYSFLDDTEEDTEADHFKGLPLQLHLIRPLFFLVHVVVRLGSAEGWRSLAGLDARLNQLGAIVLVHLVN